MKVLFLDIDGVLNTPHYKPQLPPGDLAPSYGSVQWLAYQIDPYLAAKVTRLCQATGAAVVLSSSWRDSAPLPRLAQMFRSLGLPEPIGATPNLQRVPRDHEIRHWLALAGGVTCFVVLDDMEMELPQIVSHTVLTEPLLRITDEDVAKATRILDMPP